MAKVTHLFWAEFRDDGKTLHMERGDWSLDCPAENLLGKHGWAAFYARHAVKYPQHYGAAAIILADLVKARGKK